VTAGQALRFSVPARGLGRLALFHYLTIPVSAVGGAILLSLLLERWTDLITLAGAGAGFLVGCAALKLYDARAGQYWLERVDIRQTSTLPAD